MTPEQIAFVEQSLAAVDLDELADAFYRRAFAGDPSLSAMFTTDPVVQRARFAAELDEIVRSIRSIDDFLTRTRQLGARHRGYGVRPVHYRFMGEALTAALAGLLGEEKWTAELAKAWMLAYNLTAEAMMMGAMESPIE